MHWYRPSLGARVFLAGVLPFPFVTPAVFLIGVYLFFNHHVYRIFAIPAGICALLALYVMARCFLTKVAVDGATVHVWNPSGRTSVELRPGVELATVPSNLAAGGGELVVIVVPPDAPDGHPRRLRVLATPGLDRPERDALKSELMRAAQTAGATINPGWRPSWSE